MVAASGCAGSPVKYTRSTAGWLAEPGRDAAGVGALALHAQREGLDAAHGQIAFERAQHRADGARRALRNAVECSLVRDHDAAQHVAVAGQILGHAVNAKCAPSSSGRTISGVANVLSTTSAAPAVARDLRDVVDCANAQQRIRDGLDQHAAGFGLRRPPRGTRRDRRRRRTAPPRPWARARSSAG